MKTIKFFILLGLLFVLSSCEETVEPECYEVSVLFEENGGSLVSDQIWTCETMSLVLMDSIREGYSFAGWYTDDSFTAEFENKSINDSLDQITLYAKWIEQIYTATVNENREVTITGIIATAVDDIYEIPAMINDFPVVSIASGVFDGYDNIVELTLPDSITMFPQGLLKDLTNIQKLTIPFIGETRDDEDFEGTIDYFFTLEADLPIGRLNTYVPTTLTSLHVTDATYIRRLALSNTNVSELSLNEGIVSLGNNFLMNSDSITELLIPSTVTTIKLLAFEGVNSLQTIEVSGNNNYFATDVAGHALYDYNFEELIKVTSSAKLDGFLIASTTETIYPYAFSNLEIQSITIPNSVFLIYATAFQHTASLTTLTFEENSELVVIGASAFYGSGITSLELPQSVELIERWAFSNCTDLETLIIPLDSDLEVITRESFLGSDNLNNITIPISVISIGEDVFTSTNATINVVADSIPDGWDAEWTSTILPINWGYTE